MQWPERFVLYMVFNTLVGVDQSFTIVPELARSWQVSPDGKRVTPQLQRGVKFHNYTADFAVMSRKVQNWAWIPDLVPRFRELWLQR